jgi:hypothetical protein
MNMNMFQSLKALWIGINQDKNFPVSVNDLETVMNETEQTISNLHERITKIETGVKSDFAPLTDDRENFVRIKRLEEYLTKLFPHIPLPDLMDIEVAMPSPSPELAIAPLVNATPVIDTVPPSVEGD